MLSKICWLLMLLYVKLTGTWQREFTVTGHSLPTWTDPISVAGGFTRPTTSIHWKWFTGGGETIFCWTLVFIRTAWFLGSLETYPESPFEFLFAFLSFASSSRIFYPSLLFYFSFLRISCLLIELLILPLNVELINLFLLCFIINFSIAAYRRTAFARPSVPTYAFSCILCVQ